MVYFSVLTVFVCYREYRQGSAAPGPAGTGLTASRETARQDATTLHQRQGTYTPRVRVHIDYVLWYMNTMCHWYVNTMC